jgi:hypothetical protein
MAKKKTRVMLPGGIQGLVHDLQNGTSTFQPQPVDTAAAMDDRDDDEQETVVAPQAMTERAPEAPSHPVETEREAGRQTVEETVAVETTAPVAVQRQGERPAESSVQVEGVADDRPQAGDAKPAPAAQADGRGRRPKENTMKEYAIVKDDSKDSWDLFLDMAQQYKTGGGKLATIYIDESLKNVLDRMKYAGPEKLSTSAILSSIVARFIYDHEEDIKKVLFSGNLI